MRIGWKSAQFKLGDLPDLPEDHRAKANDPSLLLDQQQAFGYTQEDIQFFLEPMAIAGDDPIGSTGSGRGVEDVPRHRGCGPLCHGGRAADRS